MTLSTSGRPDPADNPPPSTTEEAERPPAASAPVNPTAPKPPPPLMGQRAFPWLRFVIVQMLLAVAWWFVAVWLAVGLMGVGEGVAGAALWAIFFVLMLLSLVVHTMLQLRLVKR